MSLLAVYKGKNKLVEKVIENSSSLFERAY